jgi:alginate O-acetyltransferase complex protein AlgJ
MTRIRSIGDAAVCAGFALALTAPLVLHTDLKKTLASSVDSDPAEIERVYTRGMAGNRAWMSAYHHARWNVFGAIDDSVQLGDDGWLYFRRDSTWPSRIPFQDLLGSNAATVNDRARWGKLIDRRKRWAEAIGAVYLPIVVPNKDTVYPEFLPEQIRRARAQITRLDSLIQATTRDGRSQMLDLRPALVAGKEVAAAYERTDTHWNAWGAYCAYRAIIERLSHSMPTAPLPIERFELTTADFSGDLAVMSWLDDVFREASIRLEPRSAFPATYADGGATLGPGSSDPVWEQAADSPATLVTTCDDPSLPTAVVFHDSFAMKLVPYLSQHFRRIHWQWGPWDPRIVERERPSVVLHMRVEMYLDWMLK